MVPGSGPIVQHLTLWVAFLGAALAAREGKLLSLATGQLLRSGRFRGVPGVSRTLDIVAGFVGACVSTILARASYDLALLEKEFGTTFGPDLPVWIAQAVMPVAFVFIALRLAWRSGHSEEENASGGRWLARGLTLLGIVLGAWLGQRPELLEERTVWPWVGVVLLATIGGGPIFAAIGGSACLLFLADAVPLAAVPAESYRMAVSPHLPAIPLFTLAGFLLAEGDVSQRMLRLFRGFFAWAPGGTAIVCTVLCAVVTVLTGGSGVTILVLGGILLPALRSDGYGQRFSLGLLTASGSLGLLLPPALPLILFGIVAQVPIDHLFVGGILPGLLLIGLMAFWGMREAKRNEVPRTPFSTREAFDSIRQAKWELLLPVVLLASVFGGFATLVEAAALTACTAFFLQVVIRRNISLRKDLLRILRECLALLGGVLLILAVSMGLTNYLVDAEIPAQLVEFVRSHIESKLVFLLALNVFLLVVGCLMDIFSATVVVVPLIAPLGAAYGIDPVHLGIIFVANLELGYLTPPVGLNLFLASYRFQRPLLEIYRAALPMLLILGFGVLVITYLPFLTTGLLKFF